MRGKIDPHVQAAVGQEAVALGDRLAHGAADVHLPDFKARICAARLRQLVELRDEALQRGGLAPDGGERSARLVVERFPVHERQVANHGGERRPEVVAQAFHLGLQPILLPCARRSPLLLGLEHPVDGVEKLLQLGAGLRQPRRAVALDALRDLGELGARLPDRSLEQLETDGEKRRRREREGKKPRKHRLHLRLLPSVTAPSSPRATGPRRRTPRCPRIP